jgi:predicted phosphodiesterase
MKIAYISDLHCEFGDEMFNSPAPDTDVIVFAGDIGVGLAGIKWILEKKYQIPVIYICGNHEFYNQDMDETVQEIRKLAAGTNIHFLDTESITINGTTFIGATLWTDFNLFKEQENAMREARYYMNDYRCIRNGTNPFIPSEALAKHERAKDFIQQVVDSTPGPIVVVTHHAPSGISPCYHDEDFQSPPFYKSDLIDFIEPRSKSIHSWIHGHTHVPFEYKIGECTIRCNSVGYPDGRLEPADFKYFEV